MSRSRVITPSGLSDHAFCGARHHFNTLMRKGSHPFPGSPESVRGTHLHSALSGALNFLDANLARTTGKNPSSETVARWLATAESIIDNRISPQHAAFADGIKQVVRDVGEFILDKNKHDLRIHSEHVVQTGREASERIGRRVGGTVDAMLTWTEKTGEGEKRIGRIIDLKTTGERSIDAYVTNTFGSDEPMQYRLQKLFYSAAAMTSDEPSMRALDRVDMTFAVTNGKSVSYAGAATFTRPDVADMLSKIAVETAKEEADRSLMYNRLMWDGRAGLHEEMSRMLNTREASCASATCSICPLRSFCRRRFIDDAIAGRQASGVTGTTMPSTPVHTDETAAYRQRFSSVNRELTIEAEAFPVTGIASEEARRQEAGKIATSYQHLQRIAGRESMSDAEIDAIRASARAPFSMLDDSIESVWMTTRQKRVLSSITRQRIRESVEGLGLDPKVLENLVYNRVTRNQGSIDRMRDLIVRRVNDISRDEQVRVTEGTIERIIHRGDLLVNQEYLSAWIGEIDNEVIRTTMQTNREALRSKLSARSDFSFDKTTADMIRKGLLENNALQHPDVNEYFSRLARAETTKGIRERFRLSGVKIPLGAAAATLFLTYLSGADLTSQILSRKVEKAADRLREEKERVSDKSHASPYGEARRLLITDFGSRVRDSYTRLSSRLSILQTAGERGREFVKDVSTYLSSSNALKWLTSDPSMAQYRGIASLVHTPGFVFGAAALATFAVASVMNWPKRESEVADRTARKKRRLKRIKEEYWNTDSSLVEPESDLRRAYLATLPIGSQIVLSAVRELASFRGVVRFAKNEVDQAVRIIAHSRLMDDIESPLRNAMRRTQKGKILSDRFSQGGRVKRAATRALLPAHESHVAVAERMPRRLRVDAREVLRDRTRGILSRRYADAPIPRTRRPAQVSIPDRPHRQDRVVPILSGRRTELPRVPRRIRLEPSGTPLDAHIGATSTPIIHGAEILRQELPARALEFVEPEMARRSLPRATMLPLTTSVSVPVPSRDIALGPAKGLPQAVPLFDTRTPGTGGLRELTRWMTSPHERRYHPQGFFSHGMVLDHPNIDPGFAYL